MNFTYRKVVPPTLLLLVTLLAYIPALSGDWIWDDDHYVTHNSTLRSAAGLRRIWTEPDALPQYYPLVHTTYWIEYHLWGLDPAGYHLMNVLLHALGAIVLWRLLVWLKVPGAWLAAALFAVHPVEVESVAWITERKNVLSGVFFFLALLAYLRCRPDVSAVAEAPASGDSGVRTNRPLYVLAMLLFVCALLSKTVAATLPAAVLVIVWWKEGRIGRGDVLRTLPMFVLGIAAGLYTAHLERTQVGALGDEWSLSFAERCLIAGKAVWFYAWKVVWPVNLMFFYPQWKIDAGDPLQWLYPVSAVGLVVALLLQRKRIGRGPLAAALLFGGTLFPALGFFNVFPMRYSFVADHFQYLSSVALLTLFAAAATTFFARRCPNALKPLVRDTGGLDAFVSPAGIAGGLVVAVLALLTIKQTFVYADLETLWTETIKKNPACWMAHNNLGILLQNRGAPADLNRAEKHYRSAIKIRKEGYESYSNLASLYLILNRPDQAERELKKALEINPRYASAYLNYGKLHFARMDWDQAAAAFEKAIELNPQSDEAFYNLGSVLILTKEHAEAVGALAEATRLNPNHFRAYNQLGNALAEMGRLDQAIGCFQQALAVDPEYVPAYTGLAGAHILKKDYARAERYARKALELDPQNPIARRELQDIYLQTRPKR